MERPPQVPGVGPLALEEWETWAAAPLILAAQTPRPAGTAAVARLQERLHWGEETFQTCRQDRCTALVGNFHEHLWSSGYDVSLTR